MIWLEKKEQHDSDIEEDGREFGSRLEELMMEELVCSFPTHPKQMAGVRD